MKNIKVYILILIFFFPLTQTNCGCGGSSASSSTPLSIPAPAPSLIRITSPDSNGNIHVDGSAGAVDASAGVRATNSTTSGTAETTAASDGSFSLEIAGSVGDSISVVAFNSDGTTSDATTLETPDNVPALTSTPRDVAIDGSGIAYVLGVDSTEQATIEEIDLSNDTVLSSFDISLSDPQQISYDSTNDRLLVTDTTNNSLMIIDPDNTDSPTTLTVTGAQAVVHEVINNIWVVTTDDTTNSVLIIDANTQTTSDTVTITNITDPTATYQNSPAVALSGGGEIGVVSNFDDGSSQLTMISWDGASATISSRHASSSSSFQGVAIDLTSSVLVSDNTNDRVIVVDTSESTDDVIISVGDAPSRMSIDRTNSRAFVTNSGDHTVSVINLSDNSITTTPEVGLTPTGIAFDSTNEVVSTIGTENDSVTVLESTDLD